MRGPALLATSIALLQGCSVALDFEECRDDRHCDAGLSCVDARCVDRGDEEVIVAAAITEDTVWESGDRIVLDDVIFVAPGVTLTVRSGATVRGREGSALIIESGARLLARGTEFEPIVFTSDKEARLPGDWGGVALLGRAPTNAAGPVLEGIQQVDHAGFGGGEPDWSCGVLEYVRIEFAGYALEQDAELNGLTLAGCGAGTLVSHVQVHYGLDDGVEVFGGNVNLRNVVVSRAQDDGIDWDLGWTGAGQFIVVQQDENGDNSIEASNQADDHDAMPRSAPRLWNVSLVGSGGAGSQRAMTAKEGTGAVLGNLLVTGHPIEALDVRDAATGMQLTNGTFALESALMFQVGAGGAHYFPTVDEETEMMPGDERDDDEGFDEFAFFAGDERLVLGVDPGLSLAHDATMPSWVPGPAVTMQSIEPPSALFDGFDEQARYFGAFEPAVAPWTANWTAFPLE